MTRLRQDGPLATIFVELAVSDDETGLMDPLEELSLGAIRTGGAELIAEELRQASGRRELELSAEELSELGLNDRGFSDLEARELEARELEASELGFSPEEMSERGLSELERLELGLSEQELAELELAELMGFVPRPEELLAEEPEVAAEPLVEASSTEQERSPEPVVEASSIEQDLPAAAVGAVAESSEETAPAAAQSDVLATPAEPPSALPAVLNDDVAPGTSPDVLSKNGQEE
jgi:hypothetical protein